MADNKSIRSQIDLENVFNPDIECDINRRLERIGTKMETIQKHLEMLESTMRDEEDYFWRESGRSNLLVFLYFSEKCKNLGKVREQIAKTRKRSPDNIASLMALIKISETSKKTEDAKKYLNDFTALKKIENNFEKETLIAAGEVAYAFTYLGPAFYRDAIHKYEALFSQFETCKCSADDDEDLKRKTVSWHFHLAQTYNRMLNKGRREILFEELAPSGVKAVKDIFDRILRHLKIVIDSNDEFYKGKAMIELVDAFKSCETCGRKENLEFPVCYGKPDDFAFKALNIAPHDPYVLERCGRHYRQRAVNKQQLKETIAIFDKLLEIAPTRHVAWHHKGLAYRSLWLEVGKYDEARLHTNKAKQGDKKHVRPQQHHRGKPCGSYSSRVANKLPTAAYAELVVSAEETITADAPSLSLQTTGGGRPILHISQSLDQEVRGHSSELPANGPQTAPASYPTLEPKYPSSPGHCPKQPKKPDYFDTLRTNNPLAKQSPAESTEYLKMAKECFEKANELTKGIHCRYSIDLARSFFSLGSYDEALNCFAHADEHLAKSTDDNDRSYLYEQWALMRQQLIASPIDFTGDEMSDIVDLYRKSLLASVRGKQKSRIALYELRDILSKLKELDKNNTAVCLELNVLSNSVEQYSKGSAELSQLVKALMTDDCTLEVAWKMIKLLHRRQQSKNDATTAFLYLTAIHEAGKLNLEQSNNFDMDSENGPCDPSDIIEIVHGYVGDDSNKISAYGDVYRWLVGSKKLSERNFKTPQDDGIKFSDGPFDVCVVGQNSKSPGAQKLVQLLDDHCHLKVARVFSEGDDDSMLGGDNIIDGIYRLVAHSRSVMIEEESELKWRELEPVIKGLSCVRVAYICRVHYCSTETERLSKLYGWPTIKVDIEKENSWNYLAYSLLKMFFCNEATDC